MIIKDWLRFLANLKQAQIKEMLDLMTGMKGKDQRDSAEEARLQDFINSYPDPHDDGAAEMLKQARIAANEANRKSQEQSA